MLGGVITDAYTGKPLAGATITVAGRELAAGPDGAFRLTRPDATGPLRVTAPAYEPTEKVVGPTQADEVRLALRPTKLDGLVRTGDGKPLVGARVSVGGPVVVTDADGRFSLVDVPANATVTIEADDHAKFSEPVGKRVSLEAQLRSSTLTGVVTGKDGKPIQRATVALGATPDA